MVTARHTAERHRRRCRALPAPCTVRAGGMRGGIRTGDDGGPDDHGLARLRERARRVRVQEAGTSAPRSSRGRRATSHGRGAPATGTGGGAGPPARGAPPAANFFRAPHAQNLHRNTIFGHCAPRHRHAPDPILGRILGANLRRSGSAGGGRKIGMCLWQTPKDRPQMVSKCGTLSNFNGGCQ